MKKSKQNYNFLKIHLQLKKYANFIHYFNLNYLRKEWWDTDGLNNLYYKLRESNLLREKKKMQNVTTLKVWFSRRRERIGKKVRNLLSAKGREIWMDVLRKTKHRPNEMVIGVETKLKKKKKRVGRGGGGEGARFGRASGVAPSYVSGGNVLRRRRHCSPWRGRRSFINANNNGKTLCARSHDRFYPPPFPCAHRATDIRVRAGYVYTCAMLIIKADIPHAEE